MKIGLVAAIILAALTGGLYSLVTTELKDTVVREVGSEVTRSQKMHQSIARLEALDFANLVAGLSHRAAIVGVFDKADETGRRQAAFEQCEDVNSFLQKGGSRKADIVAMLDSAGKVIARDLNVNAMYGEDLRAKYPVVGLALRGEATKDIWTFDGRMMRVAVAPVIHPDGSTKGALLVGYVVDARDAQNKADLLGAQVGYFHDGKMATSSFVSEGAGDSAKEDGNKTQALNTVLFQSAEKWGQEALAKNQPTPEFKLSLDGREYAAIAAPLQGNAFSKTSGVVVLKSISDILEPVSDVGMKIIVFGVLAIIVALGASVTTALRFIKPLDKIELGVAEIINGNIDYMFKPVGQDFEGLSNALNVMLARLLGREEPNEEEGEDEADEANKWKSEQMLVEEASPTAAAGGDPEAAAMGQEGEPIYYNRIFNEYNAALKSQGKPTKGITIQAFTAKLRLIEGGLKQKWKCRMVRFRVNTQGDQVTLKPVAIF
ncbi:MAG TPA: MXAN_5187 C-terminal domain-containing protein [Polyangia bacterium]|nr:MXAN_5187 C-terminal domain-containing protein [Polyangia bacterium]